MSNTPTYSADWAAIHALFQADSVKIQETQQLIRDIGQEIRAYKQENDRIIKCNREEFQAYKQENDRVIKQNQEEFQAYKQENDRVIKQNQEEFQAYKQENDRVIKQNQEEFQAYKRENDRVIKQSQEEFQAYKKENDRVIKQNQEEFQAYKQENDRVIKQNQEEFQAYKRENDRMIQEGREELKAFQQEARAIRQASDKRIKYLDNLFTSQWGKLVESLVEGDLIKLLNEQGILVHDVCSRRHGQKNGQNYEFDLIARNGVEVVVVEVKTTLRPDDVKHFMKKLNLLKTWMPEYQENTVYGAMAWLQEHAGAYVMAEKYGLFNIRATGDSASILKCELRAKHVSH